MLIFSDLPILFVKNTCNTINNYFTYFDPEMISMMTMQDFMMLFGIFVLAPDIISKHYEQLIET